MISVPMLIFEFPGRVWVELRGGSLHVYPNEAASLPSLVVAHLVQCDVTVTHGQTELPYRVAIMLQVR